MLFFWGGGDFLHARYIMTKQTVSDLTVCDKNSCSLHDEWSGRCTDVQLCYLMPFALNFCVLRRHTHTVDGTCLDVTLQYNDVVSMLLHHVPAQLSVLIFAI